MIEHRSRIAGPAGFTLLEVIIAFVILALILGAAFGIFLTGLHNATLAGDYAGAVVLAESKLNLLGTVEPIAEGEATGRFDSVYGWHQSMRSITPPDGPAQNEKSGKLFEVMLTVFWGSGTRARQMTLQTLRLKNDAGT